MTKNQLLKKNFKNIKSLRNIAIIAHVDHGTTVKFFLNPRMQINGRAIRSRTHCFSDPGDILPLKSWASDLAVNNIDWTKVLSNMYKNLSNNFRLLQFQYKLLMRISTCRYMRYKMHIDRESPNCSLCHGSLESLPHIFIDCPTTTRFVTLINGFITANIDTDYRDPDRTYFITCSHENQVINFINLTAKWYISRQFQNKWSLIWDGYRKSVKMFLYGEKRAISTAMKQYMQFG